MTLEVIPWLSLATAVMSAVAAIASVSIASGSRYTGSVMASFNTLSTDAARADRATIVDATAARRISRRKRRAVTAAYAHQVERLAQLTVVVDGIKGNGWVTAQAPVLYIEVSKVVRELNAVQDRHKVRAPQADVRRANELLKSLPPVKNSWSRTVAKAPKGRVHA
ncbi:MULTISPECIES: hypothetical protein [unclassified Curtobacterium]|uniref:hypothetical protein n=1 Tax=unclassified Curtobacterium TaxID=257496 RepID=UPI001356B353|nr:MULTISPECIES: hypothetical protein [unclassified Curtobacterium]MBF4586530.1 hypothetical protein [Curtobacterium sp. VKM Ac-2887]